MELRERKNSFTFIFVVSIPLINILADIFTNDFDAKTLNPGSFRAFILLLFLSYFLLKRYKLDAVSKFIIIYLIYLFSRTLFSSDILFSLVIFTKAAIAFMMFPIGHYYFNDMNKFSRLNINYIWTILILVANLFLSNYFEIGTSDYLEGTFYFGSARVNITKTLAALLLCAPILSLVVKKNRYRKSLAFILLLALILVFIGVKRTAISSVLVGSIIYLLLTPRKGRTIRYLTYAAIILLIASPFFISLIETRFAARESRLAITQDTLDSEARYNEFFLVLDAMYKDDLVHMLFGSEIFNDRIYFNTTRMLHTDYMTLLNGSGIIGIIMFFGVYWKIIKEKNRYYRYINGSNLIKEFNAVFWAIILGMIILSIAGTIHEIGLRAFMFMYLGAIVRLMKEEHHSKYSAKFRFAHQVS